MLLIGFVIKIVSPGPVFFRQERVGLNGQRFTCFKFRTMHHGAPTAEHEQYLKSLMDSSDKPMVKMDQHDPRVIKAGRFLRSSGLDELPQLINVLRGEMSWVGPRPCTLPEYEAYTPKQAQRFNSLPGLTGLWQVSGKNKTTFNEMIDLDIKYAGQKSLLGDLIIMAKTPLVLFMQSKEAVVKDKTNGGDGPKPGGEAVSPERIGETGQKAVGQEVQRSEGPHPEQRSMRVAV